jgi:hypothetical protein
MMDIETYNIEVETLKLLKISLLMDSATAGTEIIDRFNSEEIKFIEYLNRFLPNRGEDKSDKPYWDIILVDYNIMFQLENLLVKYNVNYSIDDLTDLYYKKSKKIDSSLCYEIDLFIDNILNIDMVLDRINKVGIKNITKFELSYLERQSKKLTN